jgi:hypothetical protein
MKVLALSPIVCTHMHTKNTQDFSDEPPPPNLWITRCLQLWNWSWGKKSAIFQIINSSLNLMEEARKKLEWHRLWFQESTQTTQKILASSVWRKVPCFVACTYMWKIKEQVLAAKWGRHLSVANSFINILSELSFLFVSAKNLWRQTCGEPAMVSEPLWPIL